MRSSRLSVRVAALVLIALIVTTTTYTSPVVVVRAEDVAVSPISAEERAKLVQLFILALAFSDVPIDQVEKYELFHTLYVYRNGSKLLVNEPFIPGDEVLNLTYMARDVRSRIESGEMQVVSGNNTASLIWNGTEVIRVEIVEGNESWTVYAGPLYNTSLNNNTVMYWRKLYANFSGYIAEHNLVYLVRNVSETHRIYIATVAEKSEGRYLYAFTYANYWFKNKTKFFGDWVVLPEGAQSLRDYYKMIADGVRWLSANVYNGSSPGYVPTSYPQLARALEDLAKALPDELNLGVEKGYSMVTDIVWKLLVICIAAMAVAAVCAYYQRKVKDDALWFALWVVGFISGAIAVRYCLGPALDKIKLVIKR